MKFFFNGIKTADGKLIRGWFSYQAPHGPPLNSVEKIHFYARDYGDLPEEVRANFVVHSEGFEHSDYPQPDFFVMTPDGPFWIEALKAALIDKGRGQGFLLKRIEKKSPNESWADRDALKQYEREITEIRAAIERAELEKPILAKVQRMA